VGSHRVATLAIVAGLVTLAACGSTLPRPAVTPGRLSTDAPSCKDTPLTDLSQEPHYEANYLERWKTADGCELRLDVILTRHGGCSQSVDILFAWPLEVTRKSDRRLREYSQSAPGYQGDAELPRSAVDTGLRQDDRGLWLIPSDDKSVWLVSEGGAERLARGGVSCA